MEDKSAAKLSHLQLECGGLLTVDAHLFRKLKEKLKTKREIDPWFKKKFLVGYAPDLELPATDEYKFDLGYQRVAHESENSGRLEACTVCSGCLEKNCNVCVNCLDKVSNGGKNTRKRKCIKRICRNPIVPGN